MKRILLYGAIGGVLLALLQFIEFAYFIRAYPGEIYGGLIALIFTAVGIYLGLRWTRPKEDIPFAFSEERLKDVGITPREHQVLNLIAQGLSNREIADQLFVSDRYAAHMIEKARTSGATPEAVEKIRRDMAHFKEIYANPVVNVAITFMEIFPVGLVVTIVSALILRKKTPPMEPVPA